MDWIWYQELVLHWFGINILWLNYFYGFTIYIYGWMNLVLFGDSWDILRKLEKCVKTKEKILWSKNVHEWWLKLLQNPKNMSENASKRILQQNHPLKMSEIASKRNLKQKCPLVMVSTDWVREHELWGSVMIVTHG